MYNDGEYRYSLCIVYPGNNGQNISYRIADYSLETGKYTEAYYSDKFDNVLEFEPTIIGARPEELEYLEACVRKWKPKEDDDRKQWSYSYSGAAIYEVVLIRNILEAADNEDIIEILASGIEIPAFIKGSFLLPIRQVGADYEMILCSTKDFIQRGNLCIISDSVADMLHTTHQFNKYLIRRRDLINNHELRRILNNDLVNDERAFYAFDKLPDPSGKFIPRSIETYITAFIRWYCRREKARLGVTKSDMDRMFTLLDAIGNSDRESQDYFKEAPFSRDEVKDAIKSRQESVHRFLEGWQDIDDVLKTIIRDNPDLYSECEAIVTNSWMAKESALRAEETEKTKMATAAREVAEVEANKMQLKLQTLRDETVALDKHLTELKAEIELAIEKKEKVVRETGEQLVKFEENIVSSMKAAGIFDYLTQNSRSVPTDTPSKKGVFRLYQSFCPFHAADPENVSRDEFYEDFADNIGIWFENAADIAALVMAAFRHDRGIIVPSSVGRYTAMAFSMMVDAEMPLEVEVSSNWEDVFAAAEAVNQSPIRTIYIHGILDDFREPVVGTIIRLCPGKHLFFSVRDINSLNLMSRSLFEDAVFIDVGPYIKVKPDKQDLLTANADLFALVPRDVFRVEKYYNLYFADLFKKRAIEKPNAVDAAQIIQYYFQVNSDTGLGQCTRDMLKTVCVNDPDKEEDIDDALKKQRTKR